MSITKTIRVQRRWKIIEIGDPSIGSMKRNENNQYSKKRLSQCHSVHHLMQLVLIVKEIDVLFIGGRGS